MFEEIREKRDEYEKEGHSNRVATNMATNDYLKDIRKSYRRHFAEIFGKLLDLKEDPLFQTIADTTTKLRKRNHLDRDAAIREAVRLHKERLNKHAVLEKQGSDLEDSENEADDDDDSEEEN